MVQITGGTGNGYAAEVNAENRLATNSVCQSAVHHINHHEGKYFTLTITSQATAADDCIGYVQNDDDDDLVISHVYLYCSASTLLSVKGFDIGTPVGGTAIYPVNCNFGSGNAADGTFQRGNDITGLSGGSTVVNLFTAENEGTLLDFSPYLIVPKNKTCTFYVDQNSASATIGLGFGFHEH